MGCDIHLVLECKYENKWVGINTFQYHTDRDGKSSFPIIRERNYKRFAMLAGVRGDGPSPLGMPKDASELTKLMYNILDTDGHSHSYMATDKFIEIAVETEYNNLNGFCKKYPLSAYLNLENLTDLDYRVVFWFDN